MLEDTIDKSTARKIVEILAESFLAYGDLTESDLSNSNVLINKLKSLASQYELIIIKDHTDVILDTAYKLHRSGELDLTIMMYATYFEHELNRVIDHALIDKKVSSTSKNELIRAVNIRGKCGWLLELLELPPINKVHASLINEVSEKRNAFVHYKWNPSNHPDESSEKKEKSELIDKSRKTVTYMKGYVSRIKYKGNKATIKKALTKKSSRRKSTRR